VSPAAHSVFSTRIEQPFSARVYATDPQPLAVPMVRPPVCMATQRLGTVASSSLGKPAPMSRGLTLEASELSAIL
jgi:hypothetical protein